MTNNACAQTPLHPELDEKDDSVSHSSRHPTNVYRYDAEKQLELGKADVSGEVSKPSSRCSSEQRSGERIVVSFDDNDPSNPYNFSMTKKLYIVMVCNILVLNSTIGSSLATGGTQETSQYFHVTNEELLVLPTSIYLVGYVLGPLVFPPLSESYGRKPVMICTFIVFTAFTLGCALAPTYAGLICFRLLVGIGSSTPISVIGGIFADIYNTPKARGLVITLFMAATTWGPILGPVVSGFVAPVSWRWPYWVGLIIAGVTWPLLLLLPETYGPIILKRKAAKLRQETGDANIVAPVELQKQDLRELVVVVLTRPIRMFLFEAIVLTTCLYLSVAYAIFYIFFQAYPIVFEGIYGFNAGEEGLAFLPIGVGAVFATCTYMLWDSYLAKAKAQSPPAAWTLVEEYRRLPLACIGGPLFVISLFWLGWTARPDIHWIVPTLSALPFGVGFLLIFMGELNYLVDAYEVFAASAMGAASGSRSLFAVVLPFAAKPMYDRLGVAWACSILGFVSLLMTLIPFVFIRYGDNIRTNSKFCQELKKQKEEKEEQARRRQGSIFGAQQIVEDPEKQI